MTSQEGNQYSRLGLVLVLVILVALIIGGIAGIMGYRAFLSEGPGDATIWFRSIPIRSEVDALVTEVSAWPEVESVNYVSEMERYERLRRAVGSLHLLDGSSGNFFPASFELELNQPLHTSEIMRRLQETHGPELVQQVNGGILR